MANYGFAHCSQIEILFKEMTCSIHGFHPWKLRQKRGSAQVWSSITFQSLKQFWWLAVYIERDRTLRSFLPTNQIKQWGGNLQFIQWKKMSRLRKINAFSKSISKGKPWWPLVALADIFWEFPMFLFGFQSSHCMSLSFWPLPLATHDCPCTTVKSKSYPPGN